MTTTDQLADLALLLDELGVDLVLDVGARTGEFGAVVRGAGFRGDLWSFEPVAASHDQLARRAADDHHWTPFHCALGARAGEQVISVAGSSDLSSFLEPSPMAVAESKFDIAPTSFETVSVVTLDQVLTNVPIQSTVFLKLDTQGYDLEVLAGGATHMARVAAVQVEMSLDPLYVGMPSMDRSLRTLLALGFAPLGFYPVVRHEDRTLIEVDCIAIRRRQAARA